MRRNRVSPLMTAWLLGASLLAVTPAGANDYASRPEGQALLRELTAEGLDAQHVRRLLDAATRQDKILEAIAKPAERTLTWGEYRKIFIQDSRIEQGVAFWREHRELLERAEREYGVPAEIIVAIIGVETRYGQHKGTWKALDALATLGFDYPPRADFFRKELKELFLLERDAGIDAATVTGSYAGALGMPQFIPSSYRAYAVDFDKDGKIDLINSPADAIGSVASYFRAHRWETGAPVAARARVSGNSYQSLFGTDYTPNRTLDSLRQANVTPLACDGGETRYCYQLPGSTKVAALELDGAEGSEFWLANHNFYVITRYNRSRYYAMAVYQLSRDIADRMEP
ncbi:lytic murein transglycosylase B [Isoalcanivorax beigongshangi]|uniref:Lytic murein transglycosylase B n=1 Tax=Isoalcanivorax beigongshangi TaxID=3238810 RepID=A0ABV4AEN0_9GAMM